MRYAICDPRSPPHPLPQRGEGADLFGKLPHRLSEEFPLRGRDPFHQEPLRLNAGEFQQGPEDRHPSGGPVVAGRVVAIADVTTQNHHAVGALFEGANDQFGSDPSGAGDADDFQVGGVFEPGGAGQVRPGVTAPVAEETDDFRLVARHTEPPGGTSIQGIYP